MQTKLAPTIVSFWTILLLLWAGMLSAAAPSAELITFWNASNESNSAKIDHSDWQTILNRYLDVNHPSGINRFDYKSLKANSDDKQVLRDYLSYLKDLDPREYSKAEQKAYWINLYNALTIHVVLGRFSDTLKSIKKIGFFGPWDKRLIKIVRKKVTLNNIEHGILRPIWNDNRIHYAVNCASLGCPNLASEAYTADNMERLLEKGAKDYVNHTRSVQCEEGKLQISSIYDWYKVDFGGTEKKIKEYLRKYAESDLATCLRRYQGSISYDYNWDLNKP